MEAPAQGDVYSDDRSPGKCFATTLTFLYPFLKRLTAVVKPDTPAPTVMR
jgi:hypothetical protein